MKTQEITTTNLADFMLGERREITRIMKAWDEHGLPDDFETNEVTLMFNRNSGNVFLTNSEYQVAMMNGDRLKSWYHCGNCGHEGFGEDCELNDDGCNVCNLQ